MSFDLTLIFIVVIIICLFIVFFVLFKAKKKKLTLKDKTKIITELKKISSMTKNEQILYLDKILDFALFKLGKKGSFADKLRNSNKLFKDINSIWSVHKLRNKIAHELGFDLSNKEYNKSINIYKKAFKNLGINY